MTTLRWFFQADCSELMPESLSSGAAESWEKNMIGSVYFLVKDLEKYDVTLDCFRDRNTEMKL